MAGVPTAVLHPPREPHEFNPSRDGEMSGLTLAAASADGRGCGCLSGRARDHAGELQDEVGGFMVAYPADSSAVRTLMLYRVNDGGVVPIGETSTLEEKLKEADVEDWIEASPEVLGEELLVIGRQVEVNQGRDRIDLLGLDLSANLVVVELKRDLVGGDADLQVLRYAAMASRWDHATVRKIAEAYWKNTRQSRETFTKELDAFCDADYEVNGTQRVILAGRNVDPRVGTMALWLRDRGIDIRVVAIELYRDGERLYLQPMVLIPVASEEDVAASPAPSHADKEWKRDGRAWHLQQQLAPDGRALVERLIEIVGEAVPDAVGPIWSQKHYIVWKQGGRGWLRCYTDSPHQAALFPKGLDHHTPVELAERLGWREFDLEADLATKLEWGSSVGHDGHGSLRFIVKELTELEGCADEFGDVLREAWTGASGAGTESQAAG